MSQTLQQRLELARRQVSTHPARRLVPRIEIQELQSSRDTARKWFERMLTVARALQTQRDRIVCLVCAIGALSLMVIA